MTRWVSLLLLLPVAACPNARDIPPPPAESESAPKAEPPPACGKVLKGPGARPGACCMGPSAGIIKSADILAVCGAAPAAYLGEATDGGACKYQFDAGAGAADAKETFVMLTHPVIPTGARAPVAPDPLLPWKWKKIALRDAIGYQAVKAAFEPGLLERQTVLWAGRGRRIVGLHVGKRVCTEEQAHSLLQKAIDAVP